MIDIFKEINSHFDAEIKRIRKGNQNEDIYSLDYWMRRDIDIWALIDWQTKLILNSKADIEELLCRYYYMENILKESGFSSKQFSEIKGKTQNLINKMEIEDVDV